MKKEKNKASCISCRYYNVETSICTHGAGLLREIEMSDSMAEAEHGCKEYAEMTFRLTPAYLLKMALEEFNVRVPDRKVKPIFDRFMEYMIKNEYIEENETTD